MKSFLRQLTKFSLLLSLHCTLDELLFIWYKKIIIDLTRALAFVLRLILLVWEQVGILCKTTEKVVQK